MGGLAGQSGSSSLQVYTVVGLIKRDFIVTIFRPFADQVPSQDVYELLLALGEWGDIPGQLGHLQQVWLMPTAGPLLARSSHRTFFPPFPTLKFILLSSGSDQSRAK